MRMGPMGLLLAGLVVVDVALAPESVVLAQSGFVACVNPGSGEIKAAGPGGCKPGWTSVTLSTGSAGGGAVRVRDAGGKDVGAFMHGGPSSPGGLAIRQHAPYWLAILVGENGFRSRDFVRYYTSADCTGTAYLEVEEAVAPLARVAILWNNELHFPGDTIAVRTMHSWRDALADGSEDDCMDNLGLPFSKAMVTGPDTTVDPATFNLATPYVFHLAQ